jgi:hypothetical protein
MTEHSPQPLQLEGLLQRMRSGDRAASDELLRHSSSASRGCCGSRRICWVARAKNGLIGLSYGFFSQAWVPDLLLLAHVVIAFRHHRHVYRVRGRKNRIWRTVTVRPSASI